MSTRGCRLSPVAHIAILALFAAVCCGAQAQVPDKLAYQGYLTDAGGVPITGSRSMVFTLYNGGGTSVYSETQTVNVANGTFNVAIGSVTAMNLPFDVPYFLGIKVGTDAEMTPRQALLSSPYAQRADTANLLAATATVPTTQLSGTIATAQIANGAVTQSKLSPGGGTAGKVLGTDGTNLLWQSAGAGSVTSVGTGAGLSGGPITATGTINLAASQLLPTTVCAANQIAKWNGSAWLCAADANSGGTVTSVATGTGLTGGPITAAGTINLAATQLLPTVACTANQVPKWSGTAWTCAADAAPGAFIQGGNVMGASTTARIGTTDNNAVEIVVNGQRALRIEPGAVSPNVIGGSPSNGVTVGVRGAAIGGGGVAPGNTDPDFGFEAPNTVTDAYGTVAGGYANRAGDNAGTTVDSPFSTIGGGGFNVAGASYATVAGGGANTADGAYAAVGGGEQNQAHVTHAVVAGGARNVAKSQESTIGGGSDNTAGVSIVSGVASVIAGGRNNIAQGNVSAIGGGQFNQVLSADTSVISGGQYNSALGLSSSIGGGEANIASGSYSHIGGGGLNAMNCGASSNQSCGNSALGSYAAVGGGYFNSALGVSSSIGGGEANIAGGNYSHIGGGGRNTEDCLVSGFPFPLGSCGNVANGDFATIAGGIGNRAPDQYATVGGGGENKALAKGATVVGGFGSLANAPFATVVGGNANGASGAYSTTLGGFRNDAHGQYSLAAGNQASADEDSCFVFAAWGAYEAVQTYPCIGGLTNSMRFGANHGAFFDYGHQNIDGSGTNWLAIGDSVNVTQMISTSTGAYLSLAGHWVDSSDRNKKHDFVPVAPMDVLNRVALLPITTWTYNQSPDGVHHMGAVAQDFYAAFGLGDDDKHISALDTGGVALAAIQGLHQMVQQKDREIAELKERVAQVESLRTEVASLKSQAEEIAALKIQLAQVVQMQLQAARRDALNSQLGMK